MKIKNYLNLPILLLLASTFFSTSSVVNAAEFHTLCAETKGNNIEACFKVKDIQQYYELKKMLVLWEHLRLEELLEPPCCEPPKFIDELRIDAVGRRKILIDLVESLDKELETQDQIIQK